MKAHNKYWSEGQVINGRYRVSNIIMGGMGMIYICNDLSYSDKPMIALKTLLPNLQKNAKALDLFIKEALVLIRIGHLHNVISGLHFQYMSGIPFLLLGAGFGNAISLREYINNYSVFLKHKFDIALEISKGMMFIHIIEPDLIHTDLSPENILIEKILTNKKKLEKYIYYDVNIIDFGLSSINDSFDRNYFQGKLAYASPEQISLGKVSIQSDIYSYGIILYELVYEKHPFQEFMHSKEKIINAQLTVTPFFPSPEGNATLSKLNHIIEKCIEKNPEKRFESFEDIFNELFEFRIESSFSNPTLKSKLFKLKSSPLSINLNQVESDKQIEYFEYPLEYGVNPFSPENRLKIKSKALEKEATILCYIGKGIKSTNIVDSHFVNPPNIFFLTSYLQTLWEVNMHDELKKYLSIILETDPSNGQGIYFKGILIMNKSSFNEAYLTFKKLLDSNKGYAEGLIATAKREMGQCAFNLRKLDLAIEHLLDSLTSNPTDILTNVLLALVFKIKKDEENFELYYYKALTIDPHDTIQTLRDLSESVKKSA